MKRLICIMLSIALLSLSACGSNTDKETDTPSNRTVAETVSMSYSPTFIDLPFAADELDGLLYMGGRFYICYTERGDFFENLLEAISIDGQLPCVTDGVYLSTLLGNTDLLGTDAGITPTELSNILGQFPDSSNPLGNENRDGFLLTALCTNPGFIDWETGNCYFNSAEFIQILEMSALLPGGLIPYEDDEMFAGIADGTYAAFHETIFGVDTLASDRKYLGDFVSYVGFPVQEGVGHTAQTSSMCVGISSTSGHKDVAWAFVRTILEDDNQLNSYLQLLPISRTAFDLLMEEAIEGNSSWSEVYDYPEITQTDVDMLKSLMETTRYSSVSYDEALGDIILEEAAAYFAGDVTAEQAAGYIQNRVQTYVNEQR